jgi:hypothetical protein
MSQAEMEMKANKSILQNEQSEELDSSSKSVQMEEVNDENFVEAPKCDGNEEKAKSEVVQGVVQNEAQQAVEEEEDDSVEEIQSVRVDGDPSHICLSATNFDHTLIEFLQVHPLTREYEIFFFLN